MGWSFTDIKDLTYRELITAYDAHLLNEWDQSATLLAAILNLQVLLINGFGGKSLKPIDPTELHPYRKTTASGKGFRITKQNFHVLRDIFSAASR